MIRIGPAGTGGSVILGLKKIKELGLNACEIEFTYGIKMNNETASQVGELAESLGIKLSVHAPYFLNLNSTDKRKLKASKKRIIDSCEKAHYLKAEIVVFHPGFYGKLSREESYENIKNAIIDIQEILKQKGLKIKLAPETTGKINVFGSLDEIFKLVKETKCFFCIDFAHILARSNGKLSYEEMCKKIAKFKELHAHFSGIVWTEKGEKWHKITPSSEIEKLGIALKKYKIKNITIINESPDPI